MEIMYGNYLFSHGKHIGKKSTFDLLKRDYCVKYQIIRHLVHNKLHFRNHCL
jgi:hypothetical protein